MPVLTDKTVIMDSEGIAAPSRASRMRLSSATRAWTTSSLWASARAACRLRSASLPISSISRARSHRSASSTSRSTAMISRPSRISQSSIRRNCPSTSRTRPSCSSRRALYGPHDPRRSRCHHRYGPPEGIQLAVLVDRGHRELQSARTSSARTCRRPRTRSSACSSARSTRPRRSSSANSAMRKKNESASFSLDMRYADAV